MSSLTLSTDDTKLSHKFSDDEVDSEESLDPRVKGELERLNSATTEINCLEKALEEMHALFRQTLTESAFVLKSHANRYGKSINQSRPYYEALERSKKAQIATQKAALKYERACCTHQAAKEMVARAEEKLVSTSKEHKVLDPTWQDMLNKAVMKVMESEQEKCHAEKEHLETAHLFTKAGKELQDLKTKLKTAINKSRVYFDLKTKYMDQLEAHKKEVISLQGKLKVAKKDYSMSLRKLEGISDEIHEVRQSRISLCLPSRESGVGAECPGHQAPSEGRTARDWDEDGMMVLPDGRCDDSDKSTTDSTRGDTSESIPDAVCNDTSKSIPDGVCNDTSKSIPDAVCNDTSKSIPDAVCDDTSKSIPDPVCDNLDESPKISTMDRASDVSPASGACNDTAESALDAVCGDLGELPSEGTIDDFSEST